MTTTGNSGHSGYFEELADRLRAHGMDEERVTATITELRGHTAESGTAPAEEFGPADEFAAQLAGLEARIYELVGHEFNIGSPKQLEVVLFDEQGRQDFDALSAEAPEFAAHAKTIAQFRLKKT